MANRTADEMYPNPASPNKLLTIARIRKQLEPYGIRITRVAPDEFRIAYADTNDENTAYYTPDLQDAFDTGVAMYKHRHPNK